MMESGQEHVMLLGQVLASAKQEYCTKSLSSSGAVTRDTVDEIMVSTH